MELVVTMLMTSILLVGMGSVLLIATHAMPEAQGPMIRTLDATRIADQIAAELYCAVTVTRSSPTVIEFTVDRGGAKHTIRYAWSGTPGDPLTRKYDAGSVVNVLEKIQDFALTYRVKTVTEQSPPVTNESAETILASYDTPISPADYAITDKKWIGQYFLPSLPADATAWKVTRVTFPARSHGPSNGITAVQLRLPTASNLPDANVLETVFMPENALSNSYLWQQFSFASVSGLLPGRGLCLVLARQKKDKHLADIQFDSGGGVARLTTADAGGTWASDSAQSMMYVVYGTYETTKTVPTDSIVLLSVGIHLRPGAAPAMPVDTEAMTLNNPELP